MPAFSLSSPSCSVTIPISANATRPIQMRPPDQPVEQPVRRAPPAQAERRARSRARARPGTRRGSARDAPRAGPETRRGRAERRAAAAARGGAPGATAGAAALRRAASSRLPASRCSFLAARSRAEAARGLCAISSAEGTIERRAISAACGSRPQAHTGRSGGQMQPAGALGQEALDAPILERVKRDPGEHAALAQQLPGQRKRAVELPELVVDGDPQRLEGALGGMAAARSARERGSPS